MTLKICLWTNSVSYTHLDVYKRQLLENAQPALVHDQWAQTKNIPLNGGKTIEFRRYDKLPKATTPLTEGVTPKGQALNVTKVEATVQQYGGYVAISDMLKLTAIDNNICLLYTSRCV